MSADLNCEQGVGIIRQRSQNNIGRRNSMSKAYSSMVRESGTTDHSMLLKHNTSHREQQGMRVETWA